MPTPITITVAPAQRTGLFVTPNQSYPGGYSLMEFTFTGLGSGAGSDYENTNNHIDAAVEFSTDGGTVWNLVVGTHWDGQAVNIHGNIDPAPGVEAGIANVPAGCLVRARGQLVGTMTVGIGGSLT